MTKPQTLTLRHGDCVSVLGSMPEGSIGAIVSDPPYGITFDNGKGWDNLGAGKAQREWHIAWLTEAYRALKPGGIIKAFSGSRTFHHLAAAMTEVGFTGIRLEAWTYGSAFPKGQNVGLALDRLMNHPHDRVPNPYHANRKVRKDGMFTSFRKTTADGCQNAPGSPEGKRWRGWGTTLKPAFEPVVIGTKP